MEYENKFSFLRFHNMLPNSFVTNLDLVIRKYQPFSKMLKHYISYDSPDFVVTEIVRK